MAFARNVAPAVETNNAFEALAYINLYVPSEESDSGRRKIGAIKLTNKEFDAMVVARLQEEGGMQAFVDCVQFDFQLAKRAAPKSVGF